MTMVNPYFSAVGSAIEEVVAENGAELVKFDPQMDASVQAAQIDDMISMGIKALLFIPVDSAGSRNIMQACKDAGVYVVNIDNVVNENDYDVVDAIVASDNYGLGYVSGQDVVERFPRGMEFPGKGLQGTGDIGNLLLAVVASALLAAAHELQVVDDYNAEPVLQLHLPALGAKF